MGYLWTPTTGHSDAILDRLVHNAYRLEFTGKSMRDPKKPADKHS